MQLMCIIFIICYDVSSKPSPFNNTIGCVLKMSVTPQQIGVCHCAFLQWECPIFCWQPDNSWGIWYKSRECDFCQTWKPCRFSDKIHVLCEVDMCMASSHVTVAVVHKLYQFLLISSWYNRIWKNELSLEVKKNLLIHLFN